MEQRREVEKGKLFLRVGGWIEWMTFLLLLLFMPELLGPTHLVISDSVSSYSILKGHGYLNGIRLQGIIALEFLDVL